jgi:hypothetical protein
MRGTSNVWLWEKNNSVEDQKTRETEKKRNQQFLQMLGMKKGRNNC